MSIKFSSVPFIPSIARLRGAAETTTPELGDFSTNRRVIIVSSLALVIGAFSAGVAYVLLWLINVITNLAFLQRFSTAAVTPENHHLGVWVVLVPVVGALIIGLMARFGSEKIRGHGIPEALEAILLGRSKIDLKVAILKPLSAAISIGTGGPFGAEGPIIMTGGAFGSIFAQRFHLTAAERKTLLVAGAAAGMAAVFATPVAAVLLAVELLLFEWKPRSFIPVALAAIVASVLRVPLLGAGPIFGIAPHAAPGGAELAGAAVLGLMAGLGSSLLTRLVYACEDAFQHLPIHWMWWPAIGAFVVGLGGFFDPRVLGVGYGTIHSLLRGDVAGTAIAGLMMGKSLVWAVALGSGTSGGVLAPLLIMGGALGALVSPWMHAGGPSMWAMLGMAAMMGGTMRAPLTAMIFTVELTHDFHLFPALLTSSVIALGVTTLLMKRSILTEKLARRGHHITREYSIDMFELTRVGEVMDTEFVPVSEGLTVGEAASRIAQHDPIFTRRQGVLLVNESGALTGIITRSDIIRALEKPGGPKISLREAGSRNLVVTYEDEPLHVALNKLLENNIGRLPVVSRTDREKIVGYLGRASILSARHRLHLEETVRER